MTIPGPHYPYEDIPDDLPILDLKGAKCEYCGAHNVPLVAILAADHDQQVCAECHEDPRVPTITRQDLANARRYLVLDQIAQQAKEKNEAK